MARSDKQASGEQSPDVLAAMAQAKPQPAAQAPHKLVLARNFGMQIHGVVSRFWPAGTAFDPVADRELVSQMLRAGARFH